MKVFKKIIWFFDLTGFYLVMLLKANLRVAKETVSPRFSMKPSIISMPLEVTSNVAIYLLVNLVTMTPGTLSLELADNKHNLFVHVMYAQDIEKELEQIRLLEQKIKKVVE